MLVRIHAAFPGVGGERIVAVTAARHALLEHLIDDASLFPPASLQLPESIEQHIAQRSGPFAWMLGPYVCPASRLAELARLDLGVPLRISVIMDDFDVDLQSFQRHFTLAALEMKLAQFTPMWSSLDTEPIRSLDVYVEVTPEAADLASALALISDSSRFHKGRLAAKLRCGGVTPDAAPSAHAIAAFIELCHDHKVSFKATAGLHHPVRHFNREAGFMMHGFLNIAVAAALARSGATRSILTDVLLEENPTAFTVSEDAVGWRHELVSMAAVKLGRHFFHSYGSCSFAEPVADLQAMGLLPSCPPRAGANVAP